MNKDIKPFLERRIANAAFLVAMIILVAIGLLTYRNMRSAESADALETHSFIVIQEFDRLLSSLKDVETGQRGFIITGDRNYLDPYSNAIRQLSEKQASLKSLTGDNPGQQERLTYINVLIARQLKEIDSTIKVREERGFAEASEIVSTDNGKAIMDEIRQQVAKCQDDETLLLQKRQKKKTADVKSLTRNLINNGIIGLSLFLLAFMTLKLNISRLKETDKELRNYQGHLNELVNARTAELKEEIGGHKAALASLSLSEERYRGLFNSLIEGFCIIEMVFDAEGNPIDYRFLEINPAFENQTGLHGAEGKLMRELAPDHEAHWFKIYGKVATTGESVQFENEAKALNRWYDVSAFRVGGEESRKVAICFNDITERKKAEEQIVYDRYLQQLLLDNFPGVVVLLRKKTREVVASNSAGKNTGVVCGATCYQTWGQSQNPCPWCRAQELWKTGKEQHTIIDAGDQVFEAHWVPVTEDLYMHYSFDITERVRSETKMKEQEQMIQQALSIGKSFTFDWDPITDQVQRSSSCEKVFRSDYDELVNAPAKYFSRFIHPDDRPMFRNLVNKLTPSKDTYNAEFRIILTDGSVVILDETAQAFFDEEGILKRLIGVSSDITDRKRTENLLKESEEKYRELVENANSIIIKMDRDGRINYFNDYAQQFFGYSSEEILGKNVKILVPPVEHVSGRNLEEMVTAILESPDDFSENINENIRKNGEPVWVSWRNKAVRDSDGNIVGNLTVGLDITERKRAEEVSAFQARLLSEVNDAVFSSDSNFRINYWNQAAERMFGWTKEEALGNISGELLKPKTEGSTLDVVRSKLRNEGYWEGEGQYLRKDGTYFFVEVNSKVLKDADGKYMGQIVVVRDITERKRVKEALQESEEKYRELFETMTEGFALDEIILDDKGKPIDFRYLMVNPAFERHTGIKTEDIIGRTLLELFPEAEPLWIERYGEVVLTKEPAIFEESFGPLGRWFHVSVFHAGDNRFAVVFTDITDRKKMETSLSESEQRLKFHFENSPLAVVEWDSDFIVTQWSKEAEHIFGWSKEETIGKRIDTLNLIYEEDIPIVNRIMERLSSGKEQMVVSSNRNYTKSGGIIECVWYNSILLDENGQMKSVMSLVQDVTESKQAEGALRDSEKRFRVMANAMPQLAWIADADGYIFWYNQGWYDYTGTTPEEMEGWGWQSVHDPEMLPDVMEKWKASLETKKPFEMVFPLLGKDGKYRSFLTRGLPLFNNEGELMQWFGTNTDISAIQKAENDLKQAQEKLNLALDNGKIGIWERDLKTNKSIWDKRTEKMFGFAEGTYDGTFETFEKCLVEEDKPYILDAIRKAVEENAPYETIFRVRLQNDDISYINVKGVVTHNEEGKAIKLSGVCFDVTDMKKGAEQALFKLNEELHRSNKELEQFAYVASHDLQEPLKTVSTFTQLLAARYKDKLDEHGNQFIHYTVEAASRMQMLIHDLLDYSRIGTKAQKLSMVDFNNVLCKAILNLEATIREKNAVVTYDVLPTITGDEGQLVQLFQNLVGNALKYCKGTPMVHISAKEEPDYFLFSVKDNGIGIEQQYAEKVFLIFQRLVAKGEYSGSGIGLAVCKRIVERHGGKIFFESQLGEGTTFYFTIPRFNRGDTERIKDHGYDSSGRGSNNSSRQ